MIRFGLFVTSGADTRCRLNYTIRGCLTVHDISGCYILQAFPLCQGQKSARIHGPIFAWVVGHSTVENCGNIQRVTRAPQYTAMSWDVSH